jgi:hypothetical protein
VVRRDTVKGHFCFFASDLDTAMKIRFGARFSAAEIDTLVSGSRKALAAARHRHDQEGKQFFSEEKNQKTFILWCRRRLKRIDKTQAIPVQFS